MVDRSTRYRFSPAAYMCPDTLWCSSTSSLEPATSHSAQNHSMSLMSIPNLGTLSPRLGDQGPLYAVGGGYSARSAGTAMSATRDAGGEPPFRLGRRVWSPQGGVVPPQGGCGPRSRHGGGAGGEGGSACIHAPEP